MQPEKCSAERELRVTLEEMANAQRRRRIERTLVGKADAFGWRLPPDKLEQRAFLIMRYKGMTPIWVRPENGEWYKFKMCLDFDSPDLHMRCVDFNEDLHIFDPDKISIATQDARTRQFAQDRQEVADKNIKMLREAAGALQEEASRLGRKIDRLEIKTDKAVLTKEMQKDIRSFRKDTITLKRRATALEKRADDLTAESVTIRQLLARAYSEELRCKRRQQRSKQKKRLSDFVRKGGK